MELKIYCIILFLIFQVYCFIDMGVITDYLAKKSLGIGVVFCCVDRSEHAKLVSKSFQTYKYINVVNIQEGNILTKLNILNNTRKNHIGIIADADCEGIGPILEECGRRRFFSIIHHWLVLDSKNNTFNIFKNVELAINADVYVASRNSTNNSNFLSISDFYNPSFKHNRSFISTPVGSYTKQNGYNLKVPEAKYWSRKNMTGITFNAMFVLPNSIRGKLKDFLHGDDHREIGRFERLHNSVIHVCRDYYNFSLNISFTNSWGYPISNGKWDGLVGGMQENIDFGLCGIFVRADRFPYLEYGRPAWTLRTAFIFRNPKPKTSVKVFLEPLSTYTWIFTVLLGVIGGILLKFSLQQEMVTGPQFDNSWGCLVVYIIAAITQQDLPRIPTSLSGRIITFFLFVLFLLIYQFYSASIVSTLLNKVATTVKTIRDIADSSLEAGAEDILYTRDHFTVSNDDAVKDLYRWKIYKRNNKSNFMSNEAGVKLVHRGNYAFHTDVSSAYPIIEKDFDLKEICELREVELIRTQRLYNAVKKNSPYRDMMETCLQKLGTDGILHREVSHWAARKPACIQSANSRSFNVGLGDLYPAFMALAIGIGLSIILLAIEIKIRHREQNQHLDISFKHKPINPFKF